LNLKFEESDSFEKLKENILHYYKLKEDYSKLHFLDAKEHSLIEKESFDFEKIKKESSILCQIEYLKNSIMHVTE
jgi:hypothetical protein